MRPVMGYGAALLLALLLALQGCAAPTQTSQWAPPPPSSDYIVVVADGYSYLGDQDRLADARARARQDALRKAVEQGSHIFLELHARNEFGVLREDVVEKAVAGTLTDVETLIDRLEGGRYHVRIRAKVFKRELGSILLTAANPHRVEQPAPLSRVTISFYDYTEVFIPRIYRVLITAPGVSNVQRLWEGPSSLSYSLEYHGAALEPLEDWLRRELRTSLVVPFRIHSDDTTRHMEVRFDAGFD